MLVKGSCKVNINQLAIIEGKAYHPSSESEKIEMIRIDIRLRVGLNCASVRGRDEKSFFFYFFFFLNSSSPFPLV